jgi:hypothetical protein
MPRWEKKRTSLKSETFRILLKNCHVREEWRPQSFDEAVLANVEQA